MLESRLRDYSDAYTFVKGTLAVTGQVDDDAGKQADKRNNDVISKNCAALILCQS